MSSKLISDNVRQRRIIICATAIDAASLSASQGILIQALREWGELLNSVQFGLSARRWSNSNNPLTSFCAKCAVVGVITRAQNCDESWFDLATGQLGVSRAKLRSYLTHGDSLSLAILIYLTRNVFLFHLTNGYLPYLYGMSLPILEKAASDLAVQDVLPELRDEFCGLWNQLVDTARKDDRYRPITIRILKRVRRIYVDLHDFPETDPLSTRADGDPILNELSLYPRCTTHTHDHDAVPVSPDLLPDTSPVATLAPDGATHNSLIPPSPFHPPAMTQFATHAPTAAAPPTSVSQTPVSLHQTPVLAGAPSTRGSPQPQDSTASFRSAAPSHLTSVPIRDGTAGTMTTDPPPPTAGASLVDHAGTLDLSIPPTIPLSQSDGNS